MKVEDSPRLDCGYFIKSISKDKWIFKKTFILHKITATRCLNYLGLSCLACQLFSLVSCLNFDPNLSLIRVFINNSSFSELLYILKCIVAGLQLGSLFKIEFGRGTFLGAFFAEDFLATTSDIVRKTSGDTSDFQSNFCIDNQKRSRSRLRSPLTQDVNWAYIRHSEDVLDVFWTSYVRSINVLSPGGSVLY